jgi:hypothetical protein
MALAIASARVPRRATTGRVVRSHLVDQARLTDAGAMDRLRVATAGMCAAITVASLTFLIAVYRWAKDNNSLDDREHELFIISAMFACAVLAATVVASALSRSHPAFRTIGAGSAGAFVAVAASCAATLLIAIAIRDATDPGEFGRPLFRFAYAGALVLSLIVGILAAPLAQHEARTSRLAAPAIAVVLTAAAWTYLAVGSSEMNTCIVDDEFPLATNFVCSGY